MSTGPAVQLSPYDPAWPTMFEEERKQLLAVLAPVLERGIEHVGSTAVPGLAAKPIIDSMACVRSLSEVRAALPGLEALQYCYFDYRPEMHWFCKPSPEVRTHHLILVEVGGPWWEPRLLFRDYLRSHADAAAEYEALKRLLADRHTDDRQVYTDAKTAFVERTVERARAALARCDP